MAPAAPAQGGLPPVSIVTLQVVQHPDGSQSVITPKGDLATLPGAGVSGNTAEIYMGAQGGFWYVDAKGQTISLDSTVRELQARRARNEQAAQVPQYAPEPNYQAPPQQQVTVNTNNSGATSGGAVAALGTAAAAGMGAMAGAAMSNHYYNAPYGTPMYYGAGGHPYYYGQGAPREFNELNQNQKVALYNKNQINQQNKQQALQQSQTNTRARLDQSGTNQQNRQSSVAQNQTNRQVAQSGAQQQNFQKQEQWYQSQLKQNPQKFQKAANNPFVSQANLSKQGVSQSRGARSASRGGGARGGGGGRRR
jgi:hypothetical protein